MVPRFADNRDPGSLASRLRARRLAWFRSLIEGLPRPLSLLDVGGTAELWRRCDLLGAPGVSITILNLRNHQEDEANLSFVAGDARDMGGFATGQFDAVHSNSVIEHVGTAEDQRRMAREVRRVGRRYFIQTPNYWFPLEPHTLFPGFQFLPRAVQARLLQRLDLGWVGRRRELAAAEQAAASVRLLTRRELQALFPDGTITAERVLGLGKSLIAWKMAS